MGVKSDKTIVILTSDGRTAHDKNMTFAEAVGVLFAQGCVNAWKTDGGGSNSLVLKGSKQNRNIDENGTKDRNIWVTFNVKKDTINKELAKAYSFIGKERQLMNKQIRDDVEATYCKKRAMLHYYNFNTGLNVIAGESEIKIKSNYCEIHDNKPVDGDDGRVFGLIYDENEKFEGFRLNKKGLFKVSITLGVYCANIAGYRSIAIESPFGTIPASQNNLQNYIVPTANNQFHDITATFIIRNNTIGKNYYLAGWGQLGDDFNRVNIIVDEIGEMDS
jgi:hypothetical protein